MKFCYKFLTDINFEPSCIQPCCNVHGIIVPQFEFHGGAVNMKDYTKFIEECLENIQSGSSICKGCPELYDIDESKLLGKIISTKFNAVSFNMHRYLCNCRCTYCDLWKKNQVGYKILPALKSLQDQSVLQDDCFFSWGGGEPTIQPDFEDTSLYIASISKQQYIHTNAIKFSPNISHLLSENYAKINISLDSSSPKTYKAVKGVDAYNKVINNIIEYRKKSSDTAIELKYIIFDMNNSISEIESFLVFASRTLQIKNVQFSFDFREVNKKAISYTSLLAAAFFIKRAKDLNLNPIPFFVNLDILKKIIKIQL